VNGGCGITPPPVRWPRSGGTYKLLLFIIYLNEYTVAREMLRLELSLQRRKSKASEVATRRVFS